MKKVSKHFGVINTGLSYDLYSLLNPSIRLASFPFLRKAIERANELEDTLF